MAMRTWLASNSQTGISISRLVDEESFGTLFPDHNGRHSQSALTSVFYVQL